MVDRAITTDLLDSRKPIWNIETYGFYEKISYGDKKRMKPTDLWGRFPRSWSPKTCDYGSKCHPASPRGSSTGTQALDYDAKVRVPYGLSESIYNAVLSADPYGAAWFTLEDFV